MPFIGRSFVVISIASVLLCLSACDSKEEGKTATQVAARVNADEISVHQINYALSRVNVGPAANEKAPELRRQVLDKLIDQQLAVQQAMDQKLDRSPDVMMAIDAAKREILARAYIDSVGSGVSRPSEDECKKYYADHPELFSERRVYNIQEVVLEKAPDLVPQLDAMVAGGKSIEDIAGWLKSKNIKYSGGSAVRAAEQFPADLLPKIAALKDGQGMVLEGTAQTAVMRVIATKSEPVGVELAMPRIAQHLLNQRKGQAVENAFKATKAKAVVTYLGEFSGAAPVSSAPVSVVADKPTEASSIEKGVAGLK